MQCIGCKRFIKLEDLRAIVSQLPREDRAALRGTLADQLRHKSSEFTPINPRWKKVRPAFKIPCISCSAQPGLLQEWLENPPPITMDSLRGALSALPTQEKASIVGTLSASLRVKKQRAPGAGRPRDMKRKRCPGCKTNTYYRAFLRRFECCRKEGHNTSGPEYQVRPVRPRKQEKTKPPPPPQRLRLNPRQKVKGPPLYITKVKTKVGKRVKTVVSAKEKKDDPAA